MNTYHSALKPGGATHLHEGEGYLLSCALISIKRLLCFCFHTLQHWFLSWTRPPKTSLLLGTVADLARGKSELVAENALLRLSWLHVSSVRKIGAFEKIRRGRKEK